MPLCRHLVQLHMLPLQIDQLVITSVLCQQAALYKNSKQAYRVHRLKAVVAKHLKYRQRVLPSFVTASSDCNQGMITLRSLGSIGRAWIEISVRLLRFFSDSKYTLKSY